MRTTRFAIVLLGLLAIAGPVSAQGWDMPSFFSPRPGEDIGLYIIDADGVDDIGIAGIWRQEGNLNLGVRAGIVGDDHYALGAEFYGPISGVQSPILLSWVVGLGGTFNGVTWLRIPAGVSVGVDVDAGSFRILPYVHPRVEFDYFSFETPGGDESDSELNFDLDLGADVDIGRFVLRFGATVGDFDAIGIGAAYKMGRQVTVR